MYRKSGVRMAAVALLALAMSCGDDSDKPEFSMSATVDGTALKSSIVTAVTDSVFLTLTGRLSGGSAPIVMALHVTVPTTPSTVSLTGKDSTSDYAVVAQSAVTWATYYDGSGSVTFTTTNANEASGTFSFVSKLEPGAGINSTRTVTNGVFRVHF